jgi:D-lactate dehydrogenase
MLDVAVFDVKSYDRDYLGNTLGADKISWRFNEFRLSAKTAMAAKGASAVCVFVNDQVDRECLQVLAEVGVKLIALRCAGFNNVDIPAASALGFKVVRVPAYSPHAVAEHTVGLLLTLNRKIHRAYNRVRESNFSLNGLVGFDVYGKTVGIVGTGRIGRITAQIFRGFDANVIAYDPMPSQAWADDHKIQYRELEGVLRASDIVSLHVPLLTETKHLVNAKSIATMKRGVVILNTSRGKLIDTAALIEGLKSGQIGGVGLDVYEEEEGVFFEDLSGQVLQDDELSRLISFPNVLVTSHQAFLTHEALSEISRVTATNLNAFANGSAFIDGTALV